MGCNHPFLSCKHLEALLPFFKCVDFIGITEAWWDISHGCSATMDEYRLVKKDRPGWGVALHVRERQGYVELCLGMGDGPAESSLGLEGDVVLGVCCRLPDQEEVVDGVFFR